MNPLNLIIPPWVKWAVPLAFFGLLLAHDTRVNSLRAHYKTLAVEEHAGRVFDRQNYLSAQIAAQALFDAKEVKRKAEERAHNDETDRRVADLSAQYHDSVMRLKGVAAAPSHPGSTGVPKAGVPKGADGPGSDTLVSVPRSDALICADNTARLQSAHDWASSMAGTP